LSVEGAKLLAVRWSKDGVTMNDATDRTLVLAKASTSLAGLYEALALTDLGAYTAEPVRLSVALPPVLRTGPRPMFVGAGGQARFNVDAEPGAGGVITWWKDGVKLDGSGALELIVSNCKPSAGATAEIDNPAGTVR
jgi:hypothetical protein